MSNNRHIGAQLDEVLEAASDLLARKYTVATEILLPSGWWLGFRRREVEGAVVWGLYLKHGDEARAAWIPVSSVPIGIRCEAAHALDEIEAAVVRATEIREQAGADAVKAALEWLKRHEG